MPTLAIIGDSRTERADSDSLPPTREATTRAALVAAGWVDTDVSWYGRGGKDMLDPDTLGNTTIECIDIAVTDLGTIDVLYVALGTNDVGLGTTAFAAAMQTILDYVAAQPVGLVLWEGLSFWNPANTNAGTYNPVVSSTIAANAGVYVDVNTPLHSPHDDADWIYPTDSTHMTTQGWARLDAVRIAALDPYIGPQEVQLEEVTSGVGAPVTLYEIVAGTPTRIRAYVGTAATAANAATLNATAPLAIATIEGAQRDPATLATAAPLPTSSLTATATNPATLTAAAPTPTATLAATQTNPAALAGTAPTPTAATTATQTNAAALAGTAPLPTAQIADQASNTATLVANAPLPTAELTGTQTNPATLTATAPNPTASLAASQTNPATLAVVAALAAAALTGTQTNPAALAATALLPLAQIAQAATLRDITVTTTTIALAAYSTVLAAQRALSGSPPGTVTPQASATVGTYSTGVAGRRFTSTPPTT